MAAIPKSSPVLTKFLNWVERVGNALPHPAFLFFGFAIVTVIASALCASLGLQAVHPVKKNVIQAVNLLSISGLHTLLNDMTKTFTSFAPLGTVLVTMMGFGIAEKSGLLSSVLRVIVLKSPRPLLIPAILLAGVLSHTASDLGYVLLVPLAAIMFLNMGMHPLAGMALCFAGVSGGYAANFLLSTADTLLSGLTQEAARIIDPKYSVTPVANWFFMSASSVAVIAIGTLVAKKITIPFLGTYKGTVTGQKIEKLTALERRGLLAAGAVTLALVAFLLVGLVPAQGFLREIGTGDVFHSPAIRGVVGLLFLYGSTAGIAYGIFAKTIRSQDDVIQAMQTTMSTLAPYIVLVFFASQFVTLFNASNLGAILAINGAEVLKESGLGKAPIMLGFLILVCLLDFVVSSASAKWALIAPIFVPMFMLVGFSPELTQATYRIGDSVVNIVSPLMSYFPLILAFATKYEPKAKMGTVIALMLPYSIAFFLFWAVLLFIWMTFGLPLGPGAGLSFHLPTGATGG